MRKPRVLTTTKLLTVAAVATGCSTSHETISSDSPSGSVSSAPQAVLASATPGPGAMARQPPAVVPLLRSPEEWEALRRLHDEVTRLTLPAALAQPRFKALCDARGYPLAGNLHQKGMPSAQAVAYCKEVTPKP